MADPISMLLGSALGVGESLLGALGIGGAAAGAPMILPGAALAGTAGTAAATGTAAAGLSPLALVGLGAGLSSVAGNLMQPQQKAQAQAPAPQAPAPGAKAAPPASAPQGSASSLKPAGGPSFLSAAAAPQQSNTANKSLLGQ